MLFYFSYPINTGFLMKLKKKNYPGLIKYGLNINHWINVCQGTGLYHNFL
jgi:hypothetical protein